MTDVANSLLFDDLVEIQSAPLKNAHISLSIASAVTWAKLLIYSFLFFSLIIFMEIKIALKFLQTLFVTLNVVICDPTFWKKSGHGDHQPKGVWQKKLVWKEEWVKDYKIEKQVSVF